MRLKTQGEARSDRELHVIQAEIYPEYVWDP